MMLALLLFGYGILASNSMIDWMRMIGRSFAIAGTGVVASVGMLFPNVNAPLDAKTYTAAFVPTDRELTYTFEVPGVLNESWSAESNTSPYWTLNSGAKFIIEDGIGKTIQGRLATDDWWRQAYSRSNPQDSQNGFYPQNLFRLVSRSAWRNVDQEVQFNLARIHETDTPNRSGYSGIFMMSRFQDQYNLYYAGVRMDGYAVIKKKHNGTYYTLAAEKVFHPMRIYSKTSQPNLIPIDQWMAMRNVVKNNPNGTVTLELYLDRENNGNWEKVVETVDTNSGGVPAITAQGKTGLRTDYADVLFDDYRVKEI